MTDNLEAWVDLSDALMRGLVHALNNRVTAVSAFLELAALGDDPLSAQRVLPAELARLQQVNRLFRLLLNEETAPEAVELSSVLDDALALHAHHSRLHTVRCEVVFTGTIQPVRVPRWALLRLLLLLLESAKEDAKDDRDREATALLQISGGETSIELAVLTEGEPARYAVNMAALCGGTLKFAEGSVIARLPTLQELRRTERATKTALG